MSPIFLQSKSYCDKGMQCNESTQKDPQLLLKGSNENSYERFQITMNESGRYTTHTCGVQKAVAKQMPVPKVNHEACTLTFFTEVNHTYPV